MSPRGGATAVTDLTGRLRIRRRGRWRRRLIIGGVTALVVALIVGLTWLVGFSSVFAVQKVEVTGTSLLTPDQVRQQAAIPQGRPLARLDTKAAADRVRTMPEVADVFVRTKLPNVVEIAVTERKPVLVLHTPGKKELVDLDGVCFRTVDKSPQGLPPAEVTSQPDPTKPDPTLVHDLATIAHALTPALKAGTLTTHSRDTINLTLPDGNQIFFGSSADAELKVDVVTKLMAAVPKAGVYDVSSPSHPVTRPT